MKSFACLTFVLLACNCINGLFLPEMEPGRGRAVTRALSRFTRARRLSQPAHRIIDPTEDCFLVTSEEGELFFKSAGEATVCGIYMIAAADRRVQATFNYMDVPCENGGLVAWIDGWELSGQVWPADAWDEARVVETCGRRAPGKLVSRQNAALIQYRVPARGKGFSVTIRHLKNPKPNWVLLCAPGKLVSRQNAALIQYRVPARGEGFSVTIRHLKNPKPCNVMLFGSEGVFTLRNHGASGNCSVVAVAPTVVRVMDLNVGQAVKRGTSLEIETGTIHHCSKRGLTDYVDIGGASGLDHTKMEVLDNVCGLDSSEGRRPALIACEDTVVRLVSSGRFHNSVTLAFSSLNPEDIEQADLLCGMNDL